jgi:hypothetical protein
MLIYRSVAVQLDERGRRFSRVDWELEPEREVEGYRMQGCSGRPPKNRWIARNLTRKKPSTRILARRAA